jgi:TetR/AcrR family transcriptional regulator, cholesterol catabolism regulator
MAVNAGRRTRPASEDARHDRTGSATLRRRGVVLTAAAAQFAERGYQGASLRRIASESGLAPGHLYYYYPSKQELLAEIITAMQRRFNDLLESVEVSPDPATTRLRNLLEQHVVMLCRYRIEAVVSYESLRFLEPRSRSALIAERDRYEAGVGRLIDECRGELGIVDTPTTVLSKVVLGILNWTYQWYRPGGAISRSALAATLADRAVAALLAH